MFDSRCEFLSQNIKKKQNWNYIFERKSKQVVSSNPVLPKMIKKLVVLYLVINITCNVHLVSSDSKEKVKLPLCRACKVFVESFNKGMDRTKKGKFEGGDTDWEEKKLGSYATSEIRLVEIQEHICEEVVEGKDQCYSFHEDHDTEIEEWWFKKQLTEPDLFKYFCIERIEYCCPDNHFGPNCTPCPGYPDNICNKNGKCKGAGTRKGNGECSCNPGYAGQACNECAVNYYESYRDGNKFLCSKCHEACDGACNMSGPTACVKCNKGWIMDKHKGCVDVNECAAPESPCTHDQFCVNTDGSFKCLDCDKSCKGCTGDGPDMCENCAPGFKLIDNMCTDAEQEWRKKYVFWTRYLTYFGLCVATCIIFNKNTFVAAIIGIAVAIYIAVSEYILNAPPTPTRGDGLVDQLLQ